MSIGYGTQPGGGGGSGTPGGANTNVQFNDANTFGGNAGFTYDKTIRSVNITQNSVTGGAPTIFNLTGGTLSDLPNVEVIDSTFNFSRTINFLGGGAPLFLQRSLVITPPTLTADAPQSMDIVSTVHINGAPILSTNVTANAQASLVVGDLISQGDSAQFYSNLVSFTPGISNGTGNVDIRCAIGIPLAGSNTNLGNQTATMHGVYGFYAKGNNLQSDTNVRAVSNSACLYIESPYTVGTNVTVANGPYSIFVDDGDSRFDGNVECQAFFKRSTTAGITASVVQAQGQGQLTTEYNEISTCTNPNDVVTLPSANAGIQCFLVNNGANTLQIFPKLGQDLGAGVNISITLASNQTIVFRSYNSINWATQ